MASVTRTSGGRMPVDSTVTAGEKKTHQLAYKQLYEHALKMFPLQHDRDFSRKIKRVKTLIIIPPKIRDIIESLAA